MAARTLAPGQRTQVWIAGPDRPTPELVLETTQMLYEAPNWSLDGARLLLNGDGELWSLDLATPEPGPRRIVFDGLPEINSDHVLDPDGEHIYLSAADRHIYRGSLAGGSLRRRSVRRRSVRRRSAARLIGTATAAAVRTQAE